MHDIGIATADGIAYRLVSELEDLIELAGNAMHQANADGSEYEVEDELASARQAVEAYKTFCTETKGDCPAHACELNTAYDGSCLICENAEGGREHGRGNRLAAALEAAQMGLRYAVRVWVLPDEIDCSEEEIDKAVERIIDAAKKEAGND